MAEAALSFAVEKLGDLLIQKVGFLRGVEGQVKWLKSELERMQCFLKDADEKQANDERIRKWVSDIRDLAQDAEDVIETFILRVDTPRRSRGLLERWACFPYHVYHLESLGREIESIRDRLQEIDNSRERYGIQNLGDGVVVPRRLNHVERRKLSPWQRDKHLVGLKKDVELLLQKAVLEKREEGLSIASIVGMGGVGKSTLARVVYNHSAVANRFECRAWVCVSSEFDPKEIIKELVLQLLEHNEDKLKVLELMEKSPMEHLKSMLYERLKGRQYFIVLDDVWQQDAWEFLASAFPDEEEKASRLLVTSRSRNIPRSARYVHELKTLDSYKSWKLFLKKAFIDGKCPEELENVGKEIMRKCDGLPLAITVVGGLLREQRQSNTRWEKVLKGLNSHFARSENSVSAILELSYHDLPPQLKSCFLCLGFFKEDATIWAEKLVQVWIAEGLVPEEGSGGETMEEIARSCLDELINRNMVQVKDMRKDDQVKSCDIHDLLRELSIKKAKEGISFEILRDKGINFQALHQKSRHRAIYCSTERFISSGSTTNKHLRSLFIHVAGDIDIGNPSYKWRSLRLLRVLDFEGFGLTNLPNAIGALIGLRYLGLRNNKLKNLPRSLGRLKNLQVLNIAGNWHVEVPNIIWKMDSLRHLYISKITCKTPLKLDTLKNLQTLIYIPTDNWTPDHLTQMTCLRKLGIDLDEHSDIRMLSNLLVVPENLDCLNLRLSHSGRMTSLDGLVILHRLTQLELWGRLTALPGASNFPPNLSYLSLFHTYLDEDPMPVLEKLQKLSYLKLELGSYVGERMVISHDGFPKLKVLYFSRLNYVRMIKVGKGGMPELRRLDIDSCPCLESLPEELRFMSNLQELKMVTTKELALKLQGVDSHIISNIPSVDLIGKDL